MKPEQFIREQGLPEVKRLLGEAPKHSQFVIPCLDGEMYFSQREDDGKWFKWSNGYSKWLEYFGKCNPLDLAYSLSDLKRLVESVDLVELLGGIDIAKRKVKMAEFNGFLLISVPVENGFGDIYAQKVERAIRDHESIYGGGE
ncbi:hypothetical protein PL734_003615 [Acinetobacter baumannii]|nr:hypothetical protein [Acinetobacter baumannii]EKT9567945.1 hypothetical protein [Acinetobacter baumannii]EKU0986009.1 hypothetical protein [Acinetobacter baumannii]EKV7444615.1 hypothetical protein [Acinetobacter baumannii]EKY0570686.1 hypothetical protein [Acinetobacter baumannii]